MALLSFFVTPVGAQHLELEVGAGYVRGGGAEDRGPSLPARNAALVGWLTRWGLAVRIVDAPGEELYDPPVPSRDRDFLGKDQLRYWSVTVRRRLELSPKAGLELGFGQTRSGRFGDIVFFHNPPRRHSTIQRFAGFSLEGFYRRTLFKYAAVKAGLTIDGNFETTNAQPIVLGVLRY